MNENAVRDGFNVPAMLAHDKDGYTKRITVDNSGALRTCGNRESIMFRQSITLDLSTIRDKEPIYSGEETIKAVTFNIVDDEAIAYLGETTEERKITIKRAMYLETEIENIYITNTAKIGRLEIWLWW